MDEKEETRGAKKGRKITWNTRPKGVQKNKSLWGYRFTEEEYNEIKNNFKEFQKRENLKPTEAVKKIFLELIK